MRINNQRQNTAYTEQEQCVIDKLMQRLVSRINALGKANGVDAKRHANRVYVDCMSMRICYEVLTPCTYQLVVSDAHAGTVWFSKEYNECDIIPACDADAVVIGWELGHAKAFVDSVTCFCKRVRFLTNQYEQTLEQARAAWMPRQETE